MSTNRGESRVKNLSGAKFLAFLVITLVWVRLAEIKDIFTHERFVFADTDSTRRCHRYHGFTLQSNVVIFFHFTINSVCSVWKEGIFLANDFNNMVNHACNLPQMLFWIPLLAIQFSFPLKLTFGTWELNTLRSFLPASNAKIVSSSSFSRPLTFRSFLQRTGKHHQR